MPVMNTSGRQPSCDRRFLVINMMEDKSRFVWTGVDFGYNHGRREAPMAKTARRKLGLAIKASLYDALAKLAKKNGQTRSFLLEKALEHYLQVVVPSESTVRPQV